MATKVNILKLMQESRGLAELPYWHPRPRLPGPLFLPIRSSTPRKARPRKLIQVAMREAVDIPHPVLIRHLPPSGPAA